MNRRQFLKSMFGVFSTIWFGENFMEVCSALAKEQPAKLLDVRSGIENLTDSQQNYFWLELKISSVPEIISSKTSKEFLFLLKNCQAGYFGQLKDNNPYINSVELRNVNPRDCLVRLVIKNSMPEMRYALVPSVLYAGMCRLRIDVGNFSSPTAIKERDLDIRETKLTFGPLATRAFTDLIVIHHVGMTDLEESAANIHRLHLKRGWSGIGYHYVIHRDGMIERGRPRDTRGAHTYKYNDSSIGIVLDGNFENSFPTDIQLERAAMLVAALSHIYNMVPDENNLLGHRDLNATLCPGINLYTKLPQVREKALAYLKQ